MKNKQQKILITGGAGFIGTNLTKTLLEQGESIFSIDNLNNYYSPDIKEKNIEQFKDNPNYTFQKLDIKDQEALEQIFKNNKFDAVIHLAARAGVRASIENPSKYIQTNIQGTLNLLECLKETPNTKLIFASSSSVYGNITEVPFKEDMNITAPVSPYAATKLSTEAICYTYHHLYKINMAGLRFFTVYGSHNRPDMAHYKFTQAILEGKPITKYGDGNTSRDYTYVDNIVEGIIACINANLNFEIFNLGNNTPITLNQMISTLEETLNKKAIIEEKPIPQGDVMHTYADISKAKRLLNWEPKTPYREGVQKLVNWFQSQSN
jgi:UDP-glucuronate 4-epimerase